MTGTPSTLKREFRYTKFACEKKNVADLVIIFAMRHRDLQLIATLLWSMAFFFQEKDAAVSDDYGKDLASVETLQRKHEGFEV